jgi:hypothetical protein
MKKLIILLLVLCASQVFAQRVFKRSAAKFDTLTATTSIGIAGATVDSSLTTAGGVNARGIKASGKLTVSGASTVDSLYGRTLKAPTAAVTGTLLGNILNLPKRAVAAGDSVFGNMFVRSTDSLLVMWNGTAWITVADLNP